jgi:hypothetical protein
MHMHSHIHRHAAVTGIASRRASAFRPSSHPSSRYGERVKIAARLEHDQLTQSGLVSEPSFREFRRTAGGQQPRSPHWRALAQYPRPRETPCGTGSKVAGIGASTGH